MRFLVAGINIRHIALSAFRAGHEVIAVDSYCDLDLQRSIADTVLIPRESMNESLPVLIDRFSPDAVVLGPGMEEARVAGVPVLNNSPERMTLISDKFWQAQWLERNGFPFIRTQTSPQGLHFPLVVKPRRGAGGVGCRLVESAHDFLMQDGLIIQEHVLGQPVSVSVIGNGREAKALAANEQLIGVSWTGARGFRYCGNITPLEGDSRNIQRMAEEIIAGLGLVGSNGVDFLLTDEGPVVMEINARFQGSLDSVENAFGINVFQMHLASFQGQLPRTPSLAKSFGRAIVYASNDLVIKKDLCREWTADVPQPGSRISKDDPIISVFARAKTRNGVVSSLIDRAAKVREIIK